MRAVALPHLPAGSASPLERAMQKSSYLRVDYKQYCCSSTTVVLQYVARVPGTEGVLEVCRCACEVVYKGVYDMASTFRHVVCEHQRGS